MALAQFLWQLAGMFTGAVIVMGVTSCGKTSVGEGLAAKLGCAFVEGDKLHPQANIEKMSAGIPLDDGDRWPWLDIIGKAMKAECAKGRGVVASCSALKKAYRQRLATAAEMPISLIFLHGDRDLLEKRIAARKGHFMPPSLLESQLKTLEVPGRDENALHLDVVLPVDMLVELAKDHLVKRERK
jgi:gluconokinase